MYRALKERFVLEASAPQPPEDPEFLKFRCGKPRPDRYVPSRESSHQNGTVSSTAHQHLLVKTSHRGLLVNGHFLRRIPPPDPVQVVWWGMDAEGSMQEALREAEAALVCGEVPVGCAYIHPRLGVLGSGHNDTVASCNGTRHAELVALERILCSGGTAEQVAECTLYVTIEPCVMCASALRQLRVSGVVYGAGNDKFGGCGTVLDIHADGIPGLPALPARGGVCEQEAIDLLRRFYAKENAGAPNPQKRTRKQMALGEELDATAARTRDARA